MIGGIHADQSISFQAMQREAAPVRRHRPRRPGGRERRRLHRRRRSATRGFMFVALKPLGRARASRPTQVIARLRPQARAGAGRQPVPAAGAGHPRRRPRRATRSTSTRCRADDLADLRTLGAAARRARCSSVPRAHRRQHRPAGQRACRPRSSIDRDAAARLGVTRAHDRQHALRRLRPAPGRRRSTTRSTSTTW